MPQIEAIQERARPIRLLATPAQLCAVSLPAAYLSQNLTQPLPSKDGGVLRTRGEAANYVLALPHAESCNRWRRAAQLLLDQADVATVSRQVYLARFYDAQLDIVAMKP